MRVRVPPFAGCLVGLLLIKFPANSRQQQQSHVLYRENYSNRDNCNAYATLGTHSVFHPEAGKNVTCPYFLNANLSAASSSCSGDRDSLSRNGSVLWCFQAGENTNTFVGKWSVCRDKNRLTSVHFPADNSSDADKLSVLEDGQLNFASVEQFQRNAKVNCSVYDGDEECAFFNFTFTVLLRNNDEPKPQIAFSLKSREDKLYVGQQISLCVEGKSFGVRNIEWSWSRDPRLETVNITSNLSDGQSCLKCNCRESYYNSSHPVIKQLLQNKTMDGARGVAFTVLGYVSASNEVVTESWKCSGVPTHFLSFVIINDVKPEDNQTQLLFDVYAIIGDNTRDDPYTIQASYKKVVPYFEDVQQPDHFHPQHYIHLCNASISGDAHLEWRTETTTIQFPYSGEYNLSPTVLDELCQDSSSDKPFSILLKSSNKTYGDGSVYLSEEIALVICNGHQLQTTAMYACYSSDSPVEGPVFKIAGASNDQVIAIAVPIAVFIVILLIVLLVIMVFVYPYYSRLKAEAPRMFSIDHASATTGLVPTPPDFEENYTSHLEFPRENLVFVKVLGEGQFGRVFKAIAEGICPQDNSRNVVAVKTLKDNARPSDKDDLRSELETMRGMEPHPNILNFLGMCSATATDPLYILMEFAMYGSLKDYLKSVKSGKLPNPQMLLNQQQVAPGHTPPPPHHSPRLLPVPNGNAVTLSSGYPATNQQSTLSLCPYHRNQLTLFGNVTSSSAPTGGAPDNQQHLNPSNRAQAEESVSLYDMDPTSRAHATRLLRLLNSEYCLQQLIDDHGCCHGDEEEVGGATIKSGQSAYSYRGLGEVCVQRPCLDDYPFWYGTLPQNLYYNSYYNSSEHKRETSECSLADTPGSNAPLLPPPPVYVNVHQGEGDVISSSVPHHECVCHYQECTCCQATTASLNSYNNTCIYCCQCVSSEANGAPQDQRTGANRLANLDGTDNLHSESENTLSYFEVLDFAQQIARGMEHLEKMKCVHRDLAARNVLIAEGFLLKIGDFGLARDLSEKDYYRKVTPGRIPARWMALESLEERTHTPKSDVWAYGIVLWEIMTYGELPYGKSPVASGIESLTAYIKVGNRLPKPPNCSDEMYGLLKMCWEEDPELRPSFGQLVNVFSTLLDSAQEYFSLSMEDAVHQPMTAHLEANAVAGISISGGADLEAAGPVEPTILTSPYGAMAGPPVHSTSYIDEPDSPSTMWTQQPSSLPPTPPPIGLAGTTPSQSYLNLIADSANRNEDDASFNVGSTQLGVATRGRGVSEVHPTVSAAGVNSRKMTGHALANPPDIIADCGPRNSPLDLCTGSEWCEKEEGSGERTKVKHGHSRTWQKNVHCLETEV